MNDTPFDTEARKGALAIWLDRHPDIIAARKEVETAEHFMAQIGKQSWTDPEALHQKYRSGLQLLLQKRNELEQKTNDLRDVFVTHTLNR